MENPILFSLVCFLMLMLILTWVGYRLIYKPGRFMRQLGAPVITADPGRMLEIEAVLHACEGSAEMVQFQAFWKVFRLALNEVEAIG